MKFPRSIKLGGGGGRRSPSFPFKLLNTIFF
jgi:hypothetical protein